MVVNGVERIELHLKSYRAASLACLLSVVSSLSADGKSKNFSVGQRRKV